jgi:DNA polymerase I-like protein with 3'-5' exonuclease and polymerase domains
VAVAALVVDIRLRGIQVDRSRLEQLLAVHEQQRKAMAAELRTELQAPKLNLASQAQLLRALADAGLSGSDTNKETLSGCPEPIAGRILRYRQLVGLRETMRGWLESLDSNNRLYPSLNPLGAEIGRFACKNPNLLAVPRNSEIRGCFIPGSPDLGRGRL